MTTPLLQRIPLGELEPSPLNPRERLTGLEDLAASLRSVGMIQPIIAQRIPGQHKLRILAGHRRHAAAKLLAWPTVPVIVRRDMRPDAELTLMLVENGQRSGLDPIEEARAIKQLLTQGMTKSDIGRMIGRSVNFVDQRLSLLRLTAQEQEEVRAGMTAITAAVQKSRIDAGVTRRTADPKATARRWHLSQTHPLATKAKARCTRLDHARGARVSGSVACGECWEAVIRSDERQQLVDDAATHTHCPTCGHQDRPTTL